MMKFIVVSVYAIFALTAALADDLTQAMKRNVRNGLPSKVTINVTNAEGLPVPNANVIVHYPFGASGKTYEIRTDSSGSAVFEKRCMNNLAVRVNCDGYYSSALYEHFFYKSKEQLIESAKANHWLPWNLMITVKLVERKNVPKTVRHQRVIHISKEHTPIAYDVQLGILDGMANQATSQFSPDFFISISNKTESAFGEQQLGTDAFRSINLSTTNGFNGFLRLTRETTSEYPWIITAPDDGYERSITFSSRVVEGRLSGNELADDEYLLFRYMRQNGETKTIHYGLLTRFRFSHPDKLFINVILIPEQPDKRIEVNLGKELL